VGAPDLIGVVEAVYDLELDDREWLSALVRAAAPHLDAGRGVLGFYFDASDPMRVRMWHPADVGETTLPMKMRLARDVAVGRDAEAIRRIACGRTTVGSLSTELARYGLTERARPWVVLSGHGDYLGIRACDAHMRGVSLAVCHPAPFVAPSATVQRWSKLAAHIAAAYRLRRSLRVANLDPLIDDGDAVWGPDGRCHHAEDGASGEDARAELRRAVIDIDRARSRGGRSDAEEALSLWRGLVDGTWSLVERFESDGRRYLIARRNEPGVLDPRALTLREKQVVSFAALGHSNKLIAYELGVQKSVVTLHLTAAMQKLGVRDRLSLTRLIGDLGELGEYFAGEGES
jgi:DNA-binding CsgD family transcriptional regulator